MDDSVIEATPTDEVSAFVERLRPGGGSERSNYQLFLTELCDLLGVPRPDPAHPDNAGNHYVFERALTRRVQPATRVGCEERPGKTKFTEKITGQALPDAHIT